MAVEGCSPVHDENADGTSPFVVVCDHASNHMPEIYGSLGLYPEALRAHIAWDPGALPVARRLSARLDAPLLWPDASRLIIDCNRALDAPDLIPASGEGQPIPGNRDVDGADRQHRIDAIHVPYHAAIERCIARRMARRQPTALVAIHTFTPIFFGRSRPWQVGILFDDDRRLGDPIVAALGAAEGLTVGVNEPYSPADGVYYTLTRHARSRGLPAVMIEIRNDVVADEAGQAAWADRLGAILAGLAAALSPAGRMAG